MKALRVRSATSNHLVDHVAAVLARPMGGRLRQHDVDLLVVRQVVQSRHDRPAVHLTLIDLLRTVIEPRGVAEADRVGGGEQPECGMRADHPPLIEQRQPARHFKHALNDEHHVGPAGVILIEAQRYIVLYRPGQHAVPELGDLLAVLQYDRVLADEIDARNVAVQVDPDAGPVEARGDLLDVGRLAGSVIAGDQDAPVEGEARQDRQRRLAIEQVVGIEIRHVLVGLGIGRRVHVRFDTKSLPHRYARIGQAGRGFGRSRRLSRIHRSSALRPRRMKRPSLNELRSAAEAAPPAPWADGALRVTPACWLADNYRPG